MHTDDAPTCDHCHAAIACSPYSQCPRCLVIGLADDGDVAGALAVGIDCGLTTEEIEAIIAEVRTAARAHDAAHALVLALRSAVAANSIDRGVVDGHAVLS